MRDRLKILLLGDYSGCHAALAEGLRELGQEVTVASAGSLFQNTARDIDLKRPFANKIGGALLYRRALKSCEKELTDFDVVSLNNPQFIDLRPERSRVLLEKIKARNRSLFLTAMGTDFFYIKECLNTASPIKYNEWRVFDRPSPLAVSDSAQLAAWQTPLMEDYCRYVYSLLDGAQAVLYEYHNSLLTALPHEKVSYCGIPVRPEGVAHVYYGGPLKVLLGRHRSRQIEKGTDVLEKAMHTVMEHMPYGAIDFRIAENLPAVEYRKLQAEADVVLDQLYSYTPATNALWAVSRGQCAVTGAEPEYYDFIGEHELRPMLNASPDIEVLTESLCEAFSRPRELMERASAGQEFLRRHNHYQLVARRCLDFWLSRISI